jgi:hypothetical protein
MTPEDERGLFLQLARIEQKIDWVVDFVNVAIALFITYFLFRSSRGTWASNLFDWVGLPILFVIIAILRLLYGRIETIQQRAEERREAAELARGEEKRKRAEERRENLQRRWREFRGSGLFPHKECREWANSSADSPSSTEGDKEWRYRSGGQLFLEDRPPPFVRRYEDEDWKSLWFERMLDCDESRKARRAHNAGR